jgi:hypothetical protein
MTSLILLLMLTSSKVAVVSPGAFSAKQAEIAAKLTSSAKNKLDTVAKTAPASEPAARTVVKEAFPDATLSEADITTLSFYVIADVSSSMQSNVNAITEEIGRMKGQKRAVQKSLAGKNEPAATMSKVKAVGPNDYYRAPSPLPAGTSPAKLMERLSQLGAMSEANQARVIALMTQKSRFDAILSSLLPKMMQTDWTNIQSLK